MMYDVCIIGAGPAGISSAVYLKRAGFNIAVFEQNKIGGLLLNANLVENYPGFPKGITGKNLVKRFKQQLDAWKIVVRYSKVNKVSAQNRRFTLKTDNELFSSRTVIAATGTRPSKSGIAGEDTLIGSRVFYEITRMPRSLKDKKVAIIGGGDAAFDYALNLSGQGAVVDLFFRSSGPRCIYLLSKRAEEDELISVHPKTQVIGFEGKKDGITVKCSDTETNYDLALVAVGREPNNDFFPDTKVGIYYAGDVRRKVFRQVGIAVGDGLLAAMSVEKKLKVIR